MNRYGVWLVGARGGLATTLQVGARAIVHGLCSRAGLAVDRPGLLAAGLPLLEELRFGGHDIRAGTLAEGAFEIYRRNGSIRYETVEALKGDLAEIDEEIRPGVLVNSGEAIDKIGEANYLRTERTLSAAVDALAKDIASFRERQAPDGVVLVNLSSTEPALDLRDDVHREPDALLAAVRANRTDCIRSSTLYSLAALQIGAPVINFTPSNAALVEATRKLAVSRGLPYMGNDGKTGETLVKSALAPMFKYRALRVLSWQGYNMLGDRDGAVLADERNKASKLRTKDSLLAKILGYPLHTKVEIDYVPSLDDLKTAWDFIHFQGFLDYKMSMQFTWQGCDSILAAPLVLDMARMAHLALKRGESGPMRQLACFFKDPLGVDEQDLHRQFHLFLKYLGEAHDDDAIDDGACGAPVRLAPDVAVPAAAAPPAPARTGSPLPEVRK